MKAVIMAGGEGSRLRPLTCDLPKPMAPLCGKPTLVYILDLLRRHGVDEAAITLRYLPQKITEYFEEHPPEGITLRPVEEILPLGTAGGVKGAAEGFFREPFLVISGDALCSVDLTAVMEFHRQKKAAVTLVAKQVSDPREYGLCAADRDGYVTQFIEKPDWSQASTNTANTGIYVLEPWVLDLIPSDQPFDFATDLFPLLLQKGHKIAMFETKDYWCDIGDLTTYRRCQQEMLSGKAGIHLGTAIQPGIYSLDPLPPGNYTLLPPVWLGHRVEIGEGAIIGPDTVLGDGVSVAEEARVRSSILLEDARVAAGARLTGGVVCAAASLKRGASMFEGAVLGAGAVLGIGAQLSPGVGVWPLKQVADGASVHRHLQYGHTGGELFDDQGITGEIGVEMTPEFFARLGAAAGSLRSGRRVGIGCGEGADALAFKAAFSAGVLSTGARVWDFGRCLESQMAFGISFCSLDVGFYILGGATCCVKMMGQGGLSVSRPLERELQGHFSRGEFIRCGWSSYHQAADMSGIRLLYQQELYRCAPEGLSGLSARVKSLNREGERLLQNTLSSLGCDISRGPLLHLSPDGTELSLTDTDGEFIPRERLLALCALQEFKEGRDVALPSDAPQTINALAEKYGRRVYRYLDCPCDKQDAGARQLGMSQLWPRDGIMTAIRLLYLIRKSRRSLEELLGEIPKFATVCRSVSLEQSPGTVLGRLREEGIWEPDGIRLTREGGHLLLRPSKKGQKLRILAEANTPEIADELVASLLENLR